MKNPLRIFKNRFLVVTFLLLLFLIYFFNYSSQHSKDFNKDKNNLPIIAITQIVEHPALNQEKESIINFLSEHGFKDGINIKIVDKNAQGSIANASQIATQLASLKPKVLVAISTPSAQSCIKPCLENNIPMVFSAVSDPLAARLINQNPKHKNNIGGATDSIDAQVILKLMIDLLGSKLKKIGIIYNSGEVNSSQEVQRFEKIALEKGIEVVTASASKTVDVPTATSKLISEKIDAIYVPNDNTVVSALSGLNIIAEKAKVPVFSGDVATVELGVSASEGYDRKDIGRNVGKMILRVMNNEDLQEEVIVKHKTKIIINKINAKEIGLQIPNSFLQNPNVEFLGK
jgi:putative ABC transport system substrate-binding protein